MSEKINIYINSKNRNSNESSSNFHVTIPDGMLSLNKDEYFTLNVNGFYCFNSWFNVQSFNDHFQLHIYDNNNELISIEDYYLTPGNPSVLDLRADLNYLLADKVTVLYDRLKNKFRYVRTLEVDNTNYKIYLVLINSEDLLGFSRSDRNQLIELPFMEDVTSHYFVNVMGDECIVVSVAGDIILDYNNIDNFGSNLMKPTSIIFIKPIDVPSNNLLVYNNEDAGDSFQFKLANTESIKQFSLTILNQDLEQIKDFNEYILNLQFVKHKKNNNIVPVLNNILDYIREIYLMISQVLFKPPQNNF